MARGDRERARDIWLALLAHDTGESAPKHLGVRLGLARLLRELGKLEEARAQLATAADLAREVHPPDDPYVMSLAIETAMIAIAEGKTDLEPLERGLAFDRRESLDDYSVLVRFYLAQGLATTGGDRQRAVSLAVEAHARAVVSSPYLAPPILDWLRDGLTEFVEPPR